MPGTHRSQESSRQPAEGARQKASNAVYGLLLTASCLLLSGCAVLTPIQPRVPAVTHAHQPREILDHGYHEATGVIHIHTRYSDGGGTIEEVARLANQQQLDYLVITDHNTLKALGDGKQGWYGMTLVLIGTELSTRGGHYVALNIREEINRNQPTQAIIDAVNRLGGLGFLAHPYYRKRRWTDWTVHGFTGIEGYNLAHDALDNSWLRLVLWSIAVPADVVFLSMLNRPYDPLAKWDELLQREGRVVGIGSSDAHEVRLFGLKLAPYEIMLKMVRTHLLIPHGIPLSEEAVYDALRRGHDYFAIDLLADASGFVFMADDTQRALGIMGDEVALVPHLQVTAILPDVADVVLFKDGRSIATSTTRFLHVPIREPGIYRLEATRHGKPWIFSNPIYVRPPVESAHQAVGSKP